MWVLEEVQRHATSGSQGAACLVGEFVGHRATVGMTCRVNPRRVNGMVGLHCFDGGENESNVVDAAVFCFAATPSCIMKARPTA